MEKRRSGEVVRGDTGTLRNGDKEKRRRGETATKRCGDGVRGDTGTRRMGVIEAI
jgi:hypothetical protein